MVCRQKVHCRSSPIAVSSNGHLSCESYWRGTTLDPVECRRHCPAVSSPESNSDTPAMHWHEPKTSFGLLDVQELWEYRDLFLALVGRELRVRYRQVAIGAAWAILQPLAKMAIFVLVIVKGLGVEITASGVAAPVSIYAGMICWQLLSTSLRDATHVMVVNREMITKVYFPRLLLPAVPVAVACVDFAVSFVVFLPLMIWYGVALKWTCVLFPLVVVGLLLVAFAGAVWLSAANAIYRDVGYTVPLILDVGFFATPVVYESARFLSNTPDWVTWIYALNPAAGLIELFRCSLWGGLELPISALVVSLTAAVAVLVGGIIWFHKAEQTLADQV